VGGEKDGTNLQVGERKKMFYATLGDGRKLFNGIGN